MRRKAEHHRAKFYLARMAIALVACDIREKVAKRAGTPEDISDLAVTTSSAFFLFTQAAVGDGILPASPPPSTSRSWNVETRNAV
jgi:hypothetical protein